MHGNSLPKISTRKALSFTATGLAVLLSVAGLAHAKPRSPQPPFPEPVLLRFSFDETNAARVLTDATFPRQANGADESWSGYAARLDASSGAAVLAPMIALDGRPALLPGQGSVRFWYRPGWQSSGQGGTGPGGWAKLCEIGPAFSAAEGFWLTLAIEPGGNEVALHVRTGKDLRRVIQVPISWSSNGWHEVVLSFSAEGTALFVDGTRAGQSKEPQNWPAMEDWGRYYLSLGAGLDGQNAAAGEWEEAATLSKALPADYVAWNYQRLARLAALGPVSDEEILQRQAAVLAARSGMQTLSADGPPPPPGGGGGGGTNEPPPEPPPPPPGLKLTVPQVNGGGLALALREADPNDAYDVFHKMSLGPGTGWKLVAAGGPGQTNFTVPLPSTNTAFYRAASALDSDGDGLSDAFETSVTGTNPQLFDTDGDGLSDALEDSNGDGVPNYAEAARGVAVCVYASRPTATEGGLTGEFTILLPQAAPAGGVRVDYLLGGSALVGSEYSLSPGPYSLILPQGAASATITVTAVNDNIGDELDRAVELRITNATQFAWDERPAEVTLINNDAPTVRVLAVDADAAETRAGTTNAGEFLFVRDAGFNQALTVYFSVGGTAISSDYAPIGSSVTIPSGERAASVKIRPVQDAEVEGAETVNLAISASGAYTLDPSNATATVTIADDDLPSVQVVATVSDARESGQAGQFQITRTGGTGQPLSVYYMAYGTASPSNFVYGTSNIVQDYQPLPGVAVIAAGSSSVNIPVTPSPDIQLETMETVVAVIRGSTAYTIGANNTATVFIDDSNQAQFGYEVLQASAAAGNAGIQGTVDIPAEVVIRRYGTSRALQQLGWGLTTGDFVYMQTNYASPQPNQRPFTCTGTNLTFNNQYRSNGLVQFPINTWEVTMQVHASVLSRPNGAYLVVTNVLNAFGAFFFDPSQLYSVSVIQRVAIEGGQTAVVRVSRPIANGSTYFGNVYLRLKGPAMPDFGYTPFNNQFAVTVPANQTYKDVVLTAPNLPGFQGWRRLYVEVDPQQQLGVPDHRAGAVSRVEVFVKDPTLPLPQPAVDTDDDGLSDNYESANSLDPQRADDPFADSDRDGLNHLEEQAAGSRASNADTDGDGAGDFIEYLADWRSATNQALATPSLDNSTPVRLRVTSCYKCHATALQVGDYSLMSMPEYRRYTVDEVARLAKGRSYPVQVFTEFDPFSPTNHQLYGAEILAVTNPPGFLVEDPDGILGPQRVATSNLMAKIAWLHIPRIELGVDANRDNVIAFLPNTNDQTSASRPYTFWVNDDRDNGDGDTAEDLDPSAGARDNADNFITSIRDLEDFTRLHLKLDAVSGARLAAGTHTISLEWRGVSGAPSLRLFRSADAGGSLGYLTSENAAQLQKTSGGTGLGSVASGAALVLPAAFWSGASGSNLFRAFLFEGVSAGDGQLVAVLSQSGQPVAESTPVYLRLRGVTNLFEHFTVGDTDQTNWTGVVKDYVPTGDSGVYTAASSEKRDYILFVHGWRIKPWERRAFAHTAFKRLFWQNYQGRFGLFSWPTEWAALHYFPWIGGVPNPADPRNFDRSERKAWQSGRGLERLLVDLNHQYPGRVHVFAHSMGNVVVSEALHYVTERNGPLVMQSYVACQGAIAAHCFDAAAPSHALISFGLNLDSGTYNLYREYPQDTLPRTTAPFLQNLSGAGRCVNYFNSDDNALSGWEVNQNTKPDFDYQYSSRYGFFRGTQLPAHPPIYLTRRLLYIPEDTYEVFAHAAEARSKAIGAQVNVAGPFFQGGQFRQLNLGATYFWGANEWEHSAEFLSTNMRRSAFWSRLLVEFGL